MLYVGLKCDWRDGIVSGIYLESDRGKLLLCVRQGVLCRSGCLVFVVEMYLVCDGIFHQTSLRASDTHWLSASTTTP